MTRPVATPDFAASPHVTRTNGVVVTVVPSYDEGRSRPAAAAYVYTYHIEISNESNQTVQLISRHWIIRDGFGEVEHVTGEGVIGQQPVLAPGALFRYASLCPLRTPSGSMEGSYRMLQVGTEESFDAKIGKFELNNPELVN